MAQYQYYIAINVIFGCVIGLFFVTLFFLPANEIEYPISCVYKGAFNKNCATCGILRSLSYFLHGKFGEGNTINPHAFKIFLFLLIQFALRVLFSFLAKIKLQGVNRIVGFDIIVTILLFIWAFHKIITHTVSLFF